VSARSVPRSTSPAFVPEMLAASAAPELTTTIAKDAAATLIPLALLFCFISVPFPLVGGRLSARPFVLTRKSFAPREGPDITQMGDIRRVLPNRYRGVAFLLPEANKSGQFIGVRGRAVPRTFC